MFDIQRSVKALSDKDLADKYQACITHAYLAPGMQARAALWSKHQHTSCTKLTEISHRVVYNWSNPGATEAELQQALAGSRSASPASSPLPQVTLLGTVLLL